MRLLYLDIDTQRPDHLGCYGYHRNTSPNIDSIASEGVRFNNYYTSDAPCLPSRTAMMSGRFGIHTGCINHGGTTADFRPQGTTRGFKSDLCQSSLPATLKKSGLYTTYIGGFGERHSTYTFYAGFREIIDTGKGGGETAEEINESALDWIERKGGNDDWFLHINYWDPHTPYKTPMEYGNPFEGEPLIDLYTPELIEEHRKLAGPHTIQDISMYHNQAPPQFPRQPGEVRDMEEMRKLIDGYDSGIRYMDDYIGGLIDALKAKGVWEDTAVIVSADHGENFGELGLYAEHATADEATCRVPLIIRWPGGDKGERDGFHYNLDLLPTLAELFGAEPHPIWDGESFANSIMKGEDKGRDDLILSQNAHVCQRSVRFGKWLYMRTYHDGWHLWNKEMLFNLETDPYEQNDLAEKHPEICKEGAWRLLRWHDEMMETRPEGYPSDPMWLVMEEGGPQHARGRLPSYIPRLEKSGRGDKAELLKKKFPKEFK